MLDFSLTASCPRPHLNTYLSMRAHRPYLSSSSTFASKLLPSKSARPVDLSSILSGIGLAHDGSGIPADSGYNGRVLEGKIGLELNDPLGSMVSESISQSILPMARSTISKDPHWYQADVPSTNEIWKPPTSKLDPFQAGNGSTKTSTGIRELPLQ